MIKLKLYVSGPMTGLPEFNFPAFDAMAAFIEGAGMEAISPADHDRVVLRENYGAGLSEYAYVEEVPGYAEGDVELYSKSIGAVHDLLVWDIAQIVHADGIVLLPGWESSTGASHERYAAEVTGKRIFLATVDDDGMLAGFTLDEEQVRLSARPKLEHRVLEALADGAVQHLAELEERDAVSVAAWPVQLVEGKVEQLGEVRVTNAVTGGQKGSKLARFDLLPAGPLLSLAEHYGRGAAKYEARNWERGYDWSLSFAALMRHAWAFWSGEDIDEETGSSHLSAVLFHAMTLMEFTHTHPELDDRSSSAAA